jgi:glyoxylase-like metal-dependent hydrolase (beta-lactamase superfamily II)
MGVVTDYEFGISAVDSGYCRPRMNAVHLIVDNGRAAIVDTATNASVPRVLEALAAKSIAPEQVEWVMLTHIHLDHAGAAGTLMAALPNARLTAHPRGARHMVDPQRLVDATKHVYGEEETRKLYGEIVPVAAERVVETHHQTVLRMGMREFLFLDTPGHAKHHVCIVDRKSGHIFAGDTFGLSYRELDVGGRQFVFPATTPVQFDPEALHRSLEMLLDFNPSAVYVTHYSQVREVPRLAADLHRLIDAHVAVARDAQGTGADRHRQLTDGITGIVLDEAHRYGWTLPEPQLLELLAMDIELNAQGLACWLDAQAR